MRNTLIASLCSVGLLAGCPDRTISEVIPDQGRVEKLRFPVNEIRDIDILFVVDDSGSMADKQANVRANFPNFVNVLAAIPGGLPNIHLGVISSDMGTKGEADAQPGSPVGQVGQGGCANTGKSGNLTVNGASVTGNPFLSDIKLADGSRQQNYSGDLSATFGQMASLGATGCGFEQHLHAMRRALENNPANPGFLRPNAFLAVIFLADEDDCSMKHSTLLGADGGPLGPQQSFRCTRFGVICDNGGTDENQMNQIGAKSACHPNDNSAHLSTISSYVSFLKGLKPEDPTKVIVAGILGNTDPFAVETRTINGQAQPALAHSCTYNPPGGGQTQVADPAIRLQFFLDQFPNRSTSTTICQADLSGGLALIGELLVDALGDPCIEGSLFDKDVNTPGVQPDCQASYIRNAGKANETEEPLAECNGDSSNQPCWRVATDATQCPNPPNLIFTVDDPVAQPLGVDVVANCVTVAEPSI